MNVSELLSRTVEYLGRPSQDKLSLGIILPFLLDSINFYGVDLQLSSENHLLQSFTFNPSSKEELVTAPGFSAQVAVELRDASSTDEADWQGILIANASDVQDIGKDGTLAVAFFGNPKQMRWSFDPEETLVEAKLWYEPIAQEPSSLTSSPQISQAFHSMIPIRTALLCAPHTGTAEESVQLIATLTTQLAQWESKWRQWVNIDRNAKPVQKRDFRGARAVNRWNF